MQMFQTLARTMSPSDRLHVQCGACQHEAEFTQDEAVARFGADASPYEIRRRLRCGDCDAVGFVRVWI
jgi:hypothetical protein